MVKKVLKTDGTTNADWHLKEGAYKLVPLGAELSANVSLSEDQKADLADMSTLSSEVFMNHPQAIALTDLLAEVAEWSGLSIVMEPSLNRPIQIFAPHKLSPDKAFSLLIASLQTVGLRLIKMDTALLKVVAHQASKLQV